MKEQDIKQQELNPNKMENMDNHHHEQPVEDDEIKDWRKKLLWSWVFTIPIALLMLSERIFGFEIIEMPYNLKTKNS